MDGEDDGWTYIRWFFLNKDIIYDYFKDFHLLFHKILYYFFLPFSLSFFHLNIFARMNNFDGIKF